MKGVVLRQETMPPTVDRLLKYSDARSWQNQRTLTVDKGILLNWLREIVERDPFDEQKYLKTYPDVRDAVQENERSALANRIERNYYSD